MGYFIGSLLLTIINAAITIIRNLWKCKKQRQKCNILKAIMNLYIKSDIGNGWWYSLLCFSIEILVYTIIIFLLALLDLIHADNMIVAFFGAFLLIHFYVNLFGTIRT